jgi:thiamine pyrophosphate-dependent acetolactate synthase large subunit-like protein
MPRAQVVRPDQAVVDEVVAMIAEAERPIVLGGRGAMWSGAKGALESLAQESGALLATTLLGKGLFLAWAGLGNTYFWIDPSDRWTR